MDFEREIAKKVEKLPPDMQEKVLRFVTSLSVSGLTGEKGAALRQFSSSLAVRVNELETLFLSI